MPVSEIAPLEMMPQRRAPTRMTTTAQLDAMDRGRLAPLVNQRKEPSAAARDNRPDGQEDEGGYFPVYRLRQQYLDYLGNKLNEIEEQKEARHYYHGAHWTPDQIRILRSRFQPPMTWNRTGRKINGIVGLVERMRSDPKAFPNKPGSETGAEVATHVLRAVLGANDWKTRESECLRQCAIDGIAGVELKLIEGDQGDPDVGMAEVLADEYFYDWRSYRFDFADKRYDGIAKWIDVEEAVELFPDKEDLLRGLLEAGSDLTTNADREYKWISVSEKRIRLVEHWYKYRGKWCWAFYVSDVLLDQGPSPFKDERGKTISRFIMFSAAVDHDGDRYGFVRNLKGPQDALNQGKSKTLHIANSRRLIADKGAVDDVETARREWARPDGYIEKNPGKEIAPDNSQADIAAFTAFTQEAKDEIEQYGNTNLASIAGNGVTQLSGRAIELLQQPGMAELGPFILSYRGWKLRVFRAIWSIVEQYWTRERWIRVVGDDNLAQFIQVNGLGLDQYGRPAIVNALGALDVDIDLEEGRDVASLMQDTYDALKGYPPGTFPPQVLIELSPLPRTDKDRILKMLAPAQQPPDPMAELAKRLQLEQIGAQNDDLRADAARKVAEARKTHAQVDNVAADSEQKRSASVTNMARAAHLAHDAHLSTAKFAHETQQATTDHHVSERDKAFDRTARTADLAIKAQPPEPPQPPEPKQSYPSPF